MVVPSGIIKGMKNQSPSRLRTTFIRLDKGVHRELKRRAEANGTSMSEEIAKMLGVYELQLPLQGEAPKLVKADVEYHCEDGYLTEKRLDCVNYVRKGE